MQSIDESKVSCLVLLDYSKAFDLLNQELLVNILSYYGFQIQCVFGSLTT